MKNILFSSSIFLLAPFIQLNAQENTLPANGNIGIGTINPTTKLDVHGRVNIDSSLVVKDSVTIQKNLRVLKCLD